MKHIADAEAEFVVVNINPDFCKVGKKVVPFDISRDLSHEKSAYAKDVFSRGKKVLTVGSIIRGVEGNAGKGVLSGVSQGSGDVVMTEGSDLLFANSKKVCHHGHKVLMNVKS